MSATLKDIATRFTDGNNPSTKLAAGEIYELYDFYFRELADQPLTLLELGVHSGESLKTFATFFKNGKVIGIDITDRGTDFSAHPNIRFEVGDQTDELRLADICSRHSPNGIDIIIDDASHYGMCSLMSYRHLFPYLKPGGFYIVEDWGTGYWDNWPDGSRFQQFTCEATDGQLGKRIPSHDFGMVGFVKYLIDEVMSSAIRPRIDAARTRPNRLDMMHVHKELVVLKKAL